MDELVGIYRKSIVDCANGSVMVKVPLSKKETGGNFGFIFFSSDKGSLTLDDLKSKPNPVFNVVRKKDINDNFIYVYAIDFNERCRQLVSTRKDENDLLSVKVCVIKGKTSQGGYIKAYKYISVDDLQEYIEQSRAEYIQNQQQQNRQQQEYDINDIPTETVYDYIYEGQSVLDKSHFHVVDYKVSSNNVSDVFVDAKQSFGYNRSVHLRPSYENRETLMADVNKVLKHNRKVFAQISPYLDKLREWAMENDIGLSFIPSDNPSDENFKANNKLELLKVYAKTIDSWRGLVNKEFKRLKENNVEIPKDFFWKEYVDSKKGYGSVEGFLSMENFNKQRGLSVYDNNKHLICREHDDFKYVASVLHQYAFSEKEMSLLESGQSVILTDVPCNGEVKYMHYSCTLVLAEEGSPAQKCGLTHVCRLVPIDLSDERFTNVDLNERYRMNSSHYNEIVRNHRLNSVPNVEHEDVMDSESIVMRKTRSASKEPRAEELPVLKIKAYKSNTQSAINRYERRVDAYHKLRMMPPTDMGRELGFETAYDEKRFFVAVDRKNSRIDVVVKKLNAIIPNNESYEKSDAQIELENTLYDYRSELSDLAKEYEKRLLPASSEGQKIGYKSQWEEEVAGKYEELVADDKWLSKELDDDVKTILWRYYRLQETLDIRERQKIANDKLTEGHILSDNEKNGLVLADVVGTKEDKYALLSVLKCKLPSRNANKSRVEESDFDWTTMVSSVNLAADNVPDCI